MHMHYRLGLEHVYIRRFNMWVITYNYILTHIYVSYILGLKTFGYVGK